MPPFVQVEQLKKSFGKLEVLHNISFRVDKGEYVAIMGSSGSGKTTLLQLLGLLDTPNEGTISINGIATISLNERKKDIFRNQRIGFVFQFHELLPEFTALENTMLPALIRGDSFRTARKKAEELLEVLSLQHRSAHKPSELSGGEKQRVAVARALINKPDLLLADEPSGSLDEAHKEELHELFDNVKNNWGQTMIIATHDNHLAQRADRILRLEHGVILS